MKKLICLALLVFSFTMIACPSGGNNGVEFAIANGGEPQSLDPSQASGVPERRIFTALFEGLTRIDPQTGGPRPGLAESWEYSTDRTVMTFTLRPNLTFSDGTPIDANAVVDSLRYYILPTTASTWASTYMNNIAGAAAVIAGQAAPETAGFRVVGPRTVEITLTGPVPFMEERLAHTAFQILPMHIIRQYGDQWTRPENMVSSGAFNLVEWVPQNRIVAVPNPRYWDSENVFIDRLSFLPIVDQNASLNAFRNGEVDWGVHGSFPPQLIDELRLRPDFHINPSVLTEAYAFNASHAAVSDPRVRRAIAMAINRRELVDSVTRQGQTPARGWVPISMANYDHIPDEGFYNPEAARALLAEAGFPGGQGFPTIQVIYNTAETHRLNGEFIQAQLRDNLGITLNLQNMEWGSFLESRIFPTTIMFRMGWMGSDGDPMYFLQIFETGDSNNNFNYSNPEFDALLQYARTLPDGPQRMAVLRQAEDIVVVQDQVIVPLHYGVNNNLIDLSKWAGWYINPYDLHPYVGIRPR